MVKNLSANAWDARDVGLISGLGRFPGRGHGNPPTPVFLPGESHGQRSLVGCSHGVAKDRTDRPTNTLTFTVSHWMPRPSGTVPSTSPNPQNSVPSSLGHAAPPGLHHQGEQLSRGGSECQLQSQGAWAPLLHSCAALGKFNLSVPPYSHL